MACVARAARGSLIYILEMISLRIEPRNFENYLYITISYIIISFKLLSSNEFNSKSTKDIANCAILLYNIRKF